MSGYDKLKNLLLLAGLRESEALLYIDLLKNPAQTVWDLVDRTGFAKSVVYRACDKLKSLKMIERSEEGIKALSLKGLVAELQSGERKIGRLAEKLSNISPFLKVPLQPLEDIEILHTVDQVSEAYIFMSELDYDYNLDLGDFEGFIPTIGGLEVGQKYMKNRMKHAKNHAICTSYGPNTSYFCRDDVQKKFSTRVDLLNYDFDGTFSIFSDRADYVLFNKFTNSGDVSAVLVKSKVVADGQRAQFDCFSQLLGKEFS